MPSIMAWFRILVGACEKAASDLGLDGVFCQEFSTTYNWLVTTKLLYGRKCEENQNSGIPLKNKSCFKDDGHSFMPINPLEFKRA